MAENPFEYRLLASGDSFIDREDEMESLLESVKGGQNITIFSPRRYGKSSLILEAFDRLGERNTVYIDFNRVNSIPELASRLVTGVTESVFSSFEKGVSMVKDTLLSLRPTFTPNERGGISISLELVKTEEDLEKALHFSQELAEKRDLDIVIAMDEFQRINTLDGDRLERLLRSVIQEQDWVTYIFSGSQVNMLREIFESGDRPFFQSTKIMKLGKLPKDPFKEYIVRSFEKTGFNIKNDIVDEILDITEGHPMRTKELCFELWNKKQSGKEVDSVRELLYVLIFNDMYLEDTWNRIRSAVHRRTLEALANNDKPHSQESIQKYELKSNSHVQRALTSLEREGILYEGEIVDPFLRMWIKKRVVRST